MGILFAASMLICYFLHLLNEISSSKHRALFERLALIGTMLAVAAHVAELYISCIAILHASV
ncbi:MAG: hypothetical protein Q7S99_04630 [Parvibaculum sp.]|nr:hypothetical protein [Parvibaculum sp.]